ncbi:carboxypeptidase regulatory-like domain-containing protein [Negadavirga shengliensis]|uniref:Carboxypeptidase regulatory-like domain-containing protein n=1 Tax=Negadavirga shengliensis TaxID=1389218 RepID=A0ABV9T836_9BACT
MKKLLYFLLGFALLAGCRSAKISTQGLKGQVFWVEGNQMPLISENGQALPENASKKPVKRTIKIHELTHINEARLGDYLLGDIETPQVALVETDEEGRFSVELPEGMYSVFTIEEQGYFANIFDLDSYINPVEVKKKRWTSVEIIINYEAAY